MRIVLPEGRPRLEIELPDGSVAVMSPIIASDREFFQEGLYELSLESRFARFGSGRGDLSEKELDYLTRVDQRRHVALGVALGGEVAGVGRYIVKESGAEVAVTVIDRFQRRGLGTALFTALVAVARHDGVHEIQFETRSDNEAVVSMLDVIDIDPLVSDGMVEKRIRISDLPTSPADDDYVALIEELRAQRASGSASSSNDAEFTQ